MAESSGSGKKLLKWGCIGCAGVLGILVLITALVAGSAAMMARSEELQDQVLERPVPAPVEQATAGAAETGGESETTATTHLPAESAGKVELDLSGAEFQVRPGRVGEPIRVEAVYDKNSHELVETYTDVEDGTWTYRLEFRGTSNMLISGLKQLFGGTSPRVKVYLPPDAPIDLRLAIDKGAADIDLGGLWLVTGVIDMSMAGGNMAIRKPLVAPMERLELHASMGGFNIDRLGNASPGELVVDLGMSGINVDLRGDWRRDADISFNVRKGGANVSLPDDVVIEGLDNQPGVNVSSRDVDPEIALPRLRFTLTLDDDSEVEFN